MRHHYAGRSARPGVRFEKDVEVAERHDPQHPRRNGLPRTDHLPQRAAPGARMDPSDLHRASRFRRPIPRDGRRYERSRPTDHDLHRRERREPVVGSVRFQGRRRGAVHVQHRRVDPRFRSRLFQHGPQQEMAAVPEHEKYDSEKIRRPFQRHFRRDLPQRLQAADGRASARWG